jgi:hypothetical protein
VVNPPFIFLRIGSDVKLCERVCKRGMFLNG